MNIHYFQHVPFEGLGSLVNWCKKPGNSLTATKFFEDHRLPFVDICDILIVMGGPMGANDETTHTWLEKEKEFISRALDKGKKVVGICLGAQLLANVLGAKVYKNDQKEIGWFPVTKTNEGKSHKLLQSFSDKETVFHWHGDTFELPKGSVNLATSEACENQLFLYNNQAIGIQFHMELKQENIKAFIDNCHSDLISGPFVQPIEKLLNDEKIEKNNLLIDKLLTDFVNL